MMTMVMMVGEVVVVVTVQDLMHKNTISRDTQNYQVSMPMIFVVTPQPATRGSDPKLQDATKLSNVKPAQQGKGSKTKLGRCIQIITTNDTSGGSMSKINREAKCGR